MPNNVKIALYQEWPGRKYGRYSTVAMTSEPTKTISLHPATKEGLDEAIANAERADAILVKLTRDYFDAESLMKAIKRRIAANKFVRVFKPANKLPRI